MTKSFDTSTIKGIQQAGRFKARMENTHESVNVYAVGLNRVQIVALLKSKHQEVSKGKTSRSKAHEEMI